VRYCIEEHWYSTVWRHTLAESSAGQYSTVLNCTVLLGSLWGCRCWRTRCSIGFEAIRNSIVKSVNGTHIRNLRQLAEVVDSCTEEFMRFEVGRSMLVVLETKKLKDATQQVQFYTVQYT